MFAQTSSIPASDGPFIILSKVESTNNYAMAKLHAGMLVSGTSLLALEQTAGKGQRGKRWLSNAGENITMSTVFSTSDRLSGENGQVFSRYPFLFSATMALACYDFIKAFNIQRISIKWPNDLYLGDRKAAGILIENIYLGNSPEWSVVGTGINLNQDSFPSLENKAVSMAMVTGKKYDTIRMAKLLQKHIHSKYIQSLRLTPEEIMEEYNSLLFRKNEEVRLKNNNIVFSSRIIKVSINGELVTEDHIERRFKVGEVEFV